MDKKFEIHIHTSILINDYERIVKGIIICIGIIGIAIAMEIERVGMAYRQGVLFREVSYLHININFANRLRIVCDCYHVFVFGLVYFKFLMFGSD